MFLIILPIVYNLTLTIMIPFCIFTLIFLVILLKMSDIVTGF